MLDVDEYITKEGNMGVSRDGTLVASGLGNIPQTYGSRARFTETIGIEALTRADAWNYLRFAESRAGRRAPFWLISPSIGYTPVSVLGGGAGTGLSVVQTGVEADWNLRPFIGIRETDGTITIRGVSSVSRTGGNDEVTFDSGIPGLDINSIDRVGAALLCRFDEDRHVERWLTADLFRSEFRAVEMIREVDVSITNLAKVTTVGLAAAFSAAGCPGEQIVAPDPAPAVTCNNCPSNEGPTIIRAVVSGLDALYASCSAGCTNHDFSTLSVAFTNITYVDGSTIDGVYDLTYQNNCVWRKKIGEITITLYDALNCTGNPTQETADLNVEVTRGGSNAWSIKVVSGRVTLFDNFNNLTTTACFSIDETASDNAQAQQCLFSTAGPFVFYRMYSASSTVRILTGEKS